MPRAIPTIRLKYNYASRIEVRDIELKIIYLRIFLLEGLLIIYQDLIVCELNEIGLEDSVEEYHAPSYVWGSPGNDSVTIQVFVFWGQRK